MRIEELGAPDVRPRWKAFLRAVEARYPPRGRFAQLRGGRLHYLHARGPQADAAHAVVLLHGASGNACDLGLDLFRELSQRFPTFSFDRPGHGWSDRPGGAADARPDRQAALLREAIAALELPSVILVAHSWSGSVALNMALAHADLVHGVVLVGAVSHPWPGGRVSWYHSLASLDGLGHLFARIAPVGRMVTDAAVRSAFQPQEPIPDYVDQTALPLLFRPSQFRANAQDMTGLHGFLMGQASEYHRLAVPVTAIVSDRDEIVPMAHGQTLAQQSPQVRLEVLPGLGHMLQHVAVPAIVAAVEEMPVRIAEARLWRKLRLMRAPAL